MNKAKFSTTNDIWNTNHYNAECLIGAVAGLAKTLKPTSDEDFREKYYKSGAEREKIISEKSEMFNNKNYPDLNDVEKISQYVKTLKKDELYKTALMSDKNAVDINFNYGRTKEWLYSIAKLFADDINTSIDEALKYVEYRVFTQTYNGYLMEQKIIKELNSKDSNIYFKETNAFEDSYYGVDIIGENNGKIVTGIQVKPLTYVLGDNVQKKENTNDLKNKRFLTKYDTKVLYLYYWDKMKDLRLLSHEDEGRFLEIISA